MSTAIEQQLATAEITVEFEDAREEALVRQAVQGRDTHDFLSSPVGRFVVGAALQDQSEIEEQLATTSVVSEEGVRTVRELQQKHQAIGMAITWLTEAIQLGTMAERQLKEPTE